MIIRPIQAADDQQVAEIIHTVLQEFGCHGPGYPSTDPEVDEMTAAYAMPDARFYVLADGPRVLGCGGFARLVGTTTDDQACELRKMYFRPELRGRGVGRRLLARLLDEMRGCGYRRAYLETTQQMKAARHLYESFGFQPFTRPVGATGHTACDQHYKLDL